MVSLSSRSKRIIGVASALLALSGTASALEIGDRAPALTLSTSSAGALNSETLAGKLIYVDFWASWCGPCKQSFPWMNEMQQKYASQGLSIVAINVDKHRKDADRFLSQLPASFTVAFDPAGVTPKQFAVKAMPSSFLIDRNGKVVFVHGGFRDADRASIEKAIVSALAQPKR